MVLQKFDHVSNLALLLYLCTEYSSSAYTFYYKAIYGYFCKVNTFSCLVFTVHCKNLVQVFSSTKK